MNAREITILAGVLFISAIIFMPGSASDNSCIDCHEKLTAFNEKEKELNEIRIKHLQRDVACSLECHATIIDKIAKSNYEQWTNSKHAMFNVTCDNCHGGNISSDIKEIAHKGVLRSFDPNSSIFYRNVPETCGNCHSDELDQFKDSKHYEKLKALKQAPTCDTCHRPHEFKVLNITEFHDLCSSCHNNEMKIAPDIPEKAENAYRKAEELKNEIRAAENAIKKGKDTGKDVTIAQKELNAAKTIQGNLPVLWHSFNLPHFQNVTDKGILEARTAQIDAGSPPEEPSTPGFGLLISITGIISIFMLIRKKLEGA